jgi:Trypsin
MKHRTLSWLPVLALSYAAGACVVDGDDAAELGTSEGDLMRSPLTTEAPWIVQISFDSDPQTTKRGCSGLVLSPHYVLTKATCTSALATDTVQVYWAPQAGARDLVYGGRAIVQRHPDYRTYSDVPYDVALVYLFDGAIDTQRTGTAQIFVDRRAPWLKDGQHVDNHFVAISWTQGTDPGGGTECLTSPPPAKRFGWGYTVNHSQPRRGVVKSPNVDGLMGFCYSERAVWLFERDGFLFAFTGPYFDEASVEGTELSRHFPFMSSLTDANRYRLDCRMVFPGGWAVFECFEP